MPGVYVAEPQPQTGVDYENARMVLSIGAPVLEGSVRAIDAWAKRDETGRIFVHAGSSFTKTAALADRWVQLRPGSETALVNGLADVLAGKADASRKAHASAVGRQRVFKGRSPGMALAGS